MLGPSGLADPAIVDDSAKTLADDDAWQPLASVMGGGGDRRAVSSWRETKALFPLAGIGSAQKKYDHDQVQSR